MALNPFPALPRFAIFKAKGLWTGDRESKPKQKGKSISHYRRVSIT
jgi:hypothetical protein